MLTTFFIFKFLITMLCDAPTQLLNSYIQVLPLVYFCGNMVEFVFNFISFKT